MTNAPERIWIDDARTYSATFFSAGIPYVRADLLDAMTAERDAALAGAVKIKQLKWVERRNNTWEAVGYEVCHTDQDVFRVRLHGKVVCKKINGLPNAQKWVNQHHERRILAALTCAPTPALVASAYEAAENAAYNWWHEEYGLSLAGAIRALTPADAIAAQAVRDARMRAEGAAKAEARIAKLEEAANALVDFHNAPLECKRPDMFQRLISRLAAALQENSDE